jgi:hypothetical protein
MEVIATEGLFQTRGSGSVGKGWRGEVGGFDVMGKADHDPVTPMVGRSV